MELPGKLDGGDNAEGSTAADEVVAAVGASSRRGAACN